MLKNVFKTLFLSMLVVLLIASSVQADVGGNSPVPTSPSPEGVPFGTAPSGAPAPKHLTPAQIQARIAFLNLQMRQAMDKHTLDEAYQEMGKVSGFYNVAHHFEAYHSPSSTPPGQVTALTSTGVDVVQHIYINFDSYSGQYMIQGVTEFKSLIRDEYDLTPYDAMAVAIQEGSDKGFQITNNSWDCFMEDQNHMIYDKTTGPCWLKDSSDKGGAWSFQDQWVWHSPPPDMHVGHLLIAQFYVGGTGSVSNFAKSNVSHNWSSIQLQSIGIGQWPNILNLAYGSGTSHWEKDSGTCFWLFQNRTSTNCAQP